MSKLTLLLCVLGTVVAALVGGVLGIVVIALLYPGNKGPHVSSDGLNAAFLFGALGGGALAVVLLRARLARRRPRWLDQ